MADAEATITAMGTGEPLLLKNRKAPPKAEGLRPLDVPLTFSTKRLSFDSLKVLTKCGFRPCAFQIRCTLVWLMPSALASVRALQCVAAGGFSCKVILTADERLVRVTAWVGAS